MAIIALCIIPKLLQDISIFQPHYLVPLFIGHQPLPPRNPHLRPPLIFHHPLLANKLHPNIANPFFLVLHLIADILFVHLLSLKFGVEGSKGSFVVIVSIVLYLAGVEVVKQMLRVEARQKMDLRNIVAMLVYSEVSLQKLRLDLLQLLGGFLHAGPDFFRGKGF